MVDYSDELDDAYYDEDDDHGSLRERLEGLLPNVIRRTMSTGAGAKQYTEEVIRGAIGDMKLPKEAVNHLVDLADTTKREVVRVAAREFREFLDSARFNEELSKILTQLSFEIRTEIRFVPNDQALKPAVSTKARVKSSTGRSVEASDETTESINEAVRSNATELVELLLGRMLRARAEEDAEEGDDAAEAAEAEEAVAETEVEAEPEAAEPPKKKTRKRKTKASSDDDA